MKSMKKKVFAVVVAAVMLLGSMNVVFAGSNSYEHEFVGGSIAYYDAYCMDTYGSASTWIYVDGNITNVYTYVSMEFYVDGEDDVFGTDEDYSSSVSSGLATADAEVSTGSGHTGSRVESDHSSGLGGIPGHSWHLSASN